MLKLPLRAAPLHVNSSNSSRELLQKRIKVFCFWESIPKNRTIQWCFLFQSEFRKEKLNLISNWNLEVADGGPKGDERAQRGAKSWGCPRILHHLLHSPTHISEKGGYGGLGGLHFQNSCLGQEHRRRGTTGGLRGTRGDYGGLGGTTGGLQGDYGGTTGGLGGD